MARVPSTAPLGLGSTSRRATRATIDLDALAGNVRYFATLPRAGRERPAGVMAVVKANAYGHGAVAVAGAALAAGARWLAVATIDEGVELRAAGIGAPVLVLAPSDPAEAPLALRAGLTLAIGDPGVAVKIAAAARGAGGELPIHVEIDTGLHRFGLPADGAVGAVARIAALPGLRLDGLYSHFATADEADRTFFAGQRARFAAIVAALRARGIAPPHLHEDNSAAALSAPGPGCDLVRPGVALYGLSPSVEVPAPPALRPVLTLRTRVARVMALAPGDSVSYGRTFVADRPLRAALVPLGYADGYRRALSNRGAMLLGGRRAPVLGRVCMDQTVIAVPAGVEARPGDEVVAIGPQGAEHITMEEVAALAGTIAYEIATGIGARVPRDYVNADPSAEFTLRDEGLSAGRGTRNAE